MTLISCQARSGAGQLRRPAQFTSRWSRGTSSPGETVVIGTARRPARTGPWQHLQTGGEAPDAANPGKLLQQTRRYGHLL